MITELTAGHGQKLAALFNKLRGDPTTGQFFTPHALTSEAACSICTTIQDDLYYGYLADDKIVGYAMLRGMEEGHTTPSFGVAVDPDYRGNGIATLMLKHCAQEAFKLGAKNLRLTVHKDNQSARNIYEKFGFQFTDYTKIADLGLLNLSGLGLNVRTIGNESILSCPIADIYIQHLKNFGDVLHSTLVCKHYRNLYKQKTIVWATSAKYVKQLTPTANNLGLKLLSLPHGGTPDDRAYWASQAKTRFPNVVTPSVCPFGWNVGGNIVDNVLHNAKITALSTNRRPTLYHTESDSRWVSKWLTSHNLSDYVVLEYNSYTLSQPPHNATWSIELYNRLASMIQSPIVALASRDDPKLESENAVDGRGISWRRSKLLISRSRLLVGCGSGLSVLACCDGVDTPIIEINIGRPLQCAEIYHRPQSRSINAKSIEAAATEINEAIRAKRVN